MNEQPFKRGDWVIITRRDGPLCVIGQVTGPSSWYTTDAGEHESGFVIDTYYRYDPDRIDDSHPGDWPAGEAHLVYEKLAEPPAELAPPISSVSD